MARHYDDRNVFASAMLTKCDIDVKRQMDERHTVLSKDQFLALVEERAKSKAEIGRVLNLPAPRITDIYNGGRALKYEEAQTLAEHYKIDLGDRLSAERLAPILAACLQHEPRGGWTQADVQRLARELEYGLELTRSAGTTPPSQDAVDMAARVASDRLRVSLRQS